MAQEERERVMGRLRAGAADLVIATDVAARGLDIEQLSHVFIFNVPSTSEAYVHRIGRVGRAGRAGIVVTLAEPREHRLLRNIEHATKQKIHVDRLPTLADLRAKRLDMTRAALHELLVEDDLDEVRVVVESLANEFDLMQVALAAVKLAHRGENRAGDEGEEIPVLVVEPLRPPRPQVPYRGAGTRPPRGDRRTQPDASMTRIVFSAGRRAGLRPKDLVGAITGEAGIEGSAVGAIDIGDSSSVVEVASEVASQVMRALRGVRIKGMRVMVHKA
jgi:ATP-dependent RNA helicase DeaD